MKELKLVGIKTMQEANLYLKRVYMPAFNEQFKVQAREPGTMFVKWAGSDIIEILCEHYDRRVNNNNCVSFEGLKLQIPEDQYRCHYVKVKVRVHKYFDRHLAVFHGPRKLATYDPNGNQMKINSAA